MIYYVLHWGTGTDGGFGDYSPPRWSELPVEVNGRTVWFSVEDHAREAVKELNRKSREVFFSAGRAQSYDGIFPIEYEYRAIRVPVGAECDASSGVELVVKDHGERWPWTEVAGYDPSGYPDDDDDEPFDWEAELIAQGRKNE